jgi:dCMP deaminase
MKKNNHRPEWDDYFMQLAQLVATRSTCIREGRKVGAVLVRDKHILTTGFNGAPAGMAHCGEIGCIRDQLNIPSGTRHEICRAVHAEQNAIIQCALHGVSSKNSTIYVTHQPCTICTKILINAGVKRIVYQHPYPDDFAQKMIHEAGIKLEQWPSPQKAK